MASSYQRVRFPIFDGDQDNYVKLEIQWKEFPQVKNIESDLGKAPDTNMHASFVDYEKTEKAGTTEK